MDQLTTKAVAKVSDNLLASVNLSLKVEDTRTERKGHAK